MESLIRIYVLDAVIKKTVWVSIIKRTESQLTQILSKGCVLLEAFRQKIRGFEGKRREKNAANWRCKTRENTKNWKTKCRTEKIGKSGIKKNVSKWALRSRELEACEVTSYFTKDQVLAGHRHVLQVIDRALIAIIRWLKN